jgi:hypothetical protein
MKSFIFLLLATSLLTTGCESTRDSKANPFNWFGGSKKEVKKNDAEGALIPKKKLAMFRMKKDAVYLGQPIDKLSTLVVDEVPGGLLVQVTGMAQKTGFYNGQLIPLDSADPTVRGYRFDIIQPADTVGGSPASRTLSVAVYLTNQDLEAIRVIRVRGANNTLIKRR